MLLKRKIGWNFPLNDDGQENGLNDPGIETFKDTPLTSLAREVLQNSSDAADDKSKKPVEVHFTLLHIPASEFPGAKDFKKTLDACSAYWKTVKKTTDFFKEARAVLSSAEIPVLKISDYNTTGLVVGATNDRNSDWFKITKAVGSSDKNAGKLGSFGIGKHAPFACSDLRTVFYGTRDKDGATAFQGVSKLVSFKIDKKVTQGTGYYGIKLGNKPILDFSAISPLFERKRTGADLYVMGFHAFPDWEDRIIKSVIESFFVAIHNGRLIVKVGKTTLNSTNLPDHIRKHYAEPDPQFFADEYYEALISEESSVDTEEDFRGLGQIKLRVLENKDFKKKVAMFRRSGMKIFDKGHFQTPLRFAGVFTVEGVDLDAVLRTLEPPSHDDWKWERGDDPAEAKRLLHDLKGWINEKVRQLISAEQVSEIDAEGISQYLPDELDDSETGTPQQVESLDDEPSPVLDMRIRSSPPPVSSRHPENGSQDDPTEDEGDEGAPESSNRTGEGGEGGAEEGNGKGEHGVGGGQDGIDHAKRIGLANLRIYCADASAGRYRLLFNPQSEGLQQLRVFVIGEVGAEPAPITRFTVNGGPEVTLNGDKGIIEPLSLPVGKRAVLEVVLKDSLHCALGVTAYAG